jgi:hypothetical protein
MATDFESKLPVRTSGVYDGTDNKEPSNNGLVAHTRAAAPGDAEQVKRITGVTNGSIHALDISLHDHAGAAFGPANPLYVNVTNGATGAEVLDYHEYADIAKNASSSYSYSPASGQILSLQKIHLSASGRFKAVIEIGTTGSEVTKVVLFNSTANPNAGYDFSLPQSVTDAESVKITVTNIDRETQSIYVSIEGVENAA